MPSFSRDEAGRDSRSEPCRTIPQAWDDRTASPTVLIGYDLSSKSQRQAPSRNLLTSDSLELESPGKKSVHGKSRNPARVAASRSGNCTGIAAPPSLYSPPAEASGQTSWHQPGLP